MYIIPPLPKPIKIMPLGDSNTRGWTVDNDSSIRRNCPIGYRYKLYNSLIDGGYEVDFVGSKENPIEGPCDSGQYPLDFDREHEGYNGKTASWLAGNIKNILTDSYPDVILLHIGTNDLRLNTIDDYCKDNPDVEEEAVPCAVLSVMRILDEIDTWERQNNQEIIVFLALIIKAHPSFSLVDNYNNLVEDFNDHLFLDALSRINNDDDKIILVDMENDAGIQYEDDMNSDTSNEMNLLHALPSGYEKMADLWFQHLVNFLPIPE
jgi:lysophospholipase L1-like esterase